MIVAPEQAAPGFAARPGADAPGRAIDSELRQHLSASSCGGRQAVGGSDALKKPALPGFSLEIVWHQLRYEMLLFNPKFWRTAQCVIGM